MLAHLCEQIKSMYKENTLRMFREGGQKKHPRTDRYNLDIDKGQWGSDPCIGVVTHSQTWQGLRFHQGKTKCLSPVHHCIEATAEHKTEDSPGQESNHSSMDIHVAKELVTSVAGADQESEQPAREGVQSQNPCKAKLKLPTSYQ